MRLIKLRLTSSIDSSMQGVGFSNSKCLSQLVLLEIHRINNNENLAAIHSKVYETNFNERNEAHLVLNYPCSPAVAITTVFGQPTRLHKFKTIESWLWIAAIIRFT